MGNWSSAYATSLDDTDAVALRLLAPALAYGPRLAGFLADGSCALSPTASRG